MKTFLLSALVLSLGVSAARADTAPATDAHQNAPAPAQQQETRTIELSGLNGRVTIVVNDSRTTLNQQQAPYALQGSGSAQPASPTGSGYQAR